MARLLLVVAGFWLGMLAASWVMATVNFRTVDRVIGPGVRPVALAAWTVARRP
jgi:hypothetical protein